MKHINTASMPDLIDSFLKLSSKGPTGKSIEDSCWESSLERDFEKFIMQTLSAINIKVLKVYDKTARYTEPDLLCRYRSPDGQARVFSVEVKKRDKDYSETQKQAFEELGEFTDIYKVSSFTELTDMLKALLALNAPAV